MSDIEVPKGLTNVIVDETGIATTDSTGNLLYRGYKVVDLVRKLGFEDVAYLIVYGKVPTEQERNSFFARIKENSMIDGSVEDVMRILKEKDVMRNIRSIVSLYPYTSEKSDDLLVEIAAKIPKIVSDSYRIAHNLPLVDDADGSFAERFYYLITGNRDPEKSKYLERLMIMYMEHEFNASTFALRVTASTLADPVAAVTSALATLKGPLHGGASAEILDFFLGFKSGEDAVKYIDDKIEKKEKIMGFGHRIYKDMDPRAQYIKEQLRQMAGDSSLFRIAVAIEERMWEKKKIPANLDFYAAIYMHLLGIDQDFYTPIFAASRVFGWIAHYNEQLQNNKIIRPSSKYVGPTGLSL